jgi:hypothetical protein
MTIEKDEVTLTVEELAYHYIDHSTGKDASEIISVYNYGSKVTIRFIDREFLLDVLHSVDVYISGDKGEYLKKLINKDLENYPEKVEEDPRVLGVIAGQNNLSTIEETQKFLEDKFDSPTYGDLQSPAAEKLRARPTPIDTHEGVGTDKDISL